MNASPTDDRRRDGTIVWHHMVNPTGCLMGGLVGLSCGTMIAMVLAVCSVPNRVVLLAFMALVLLGAVTGILAAPYEVHTVEVTERRVRLISKSATRGVDVTNLTRVSIVHTGDTDWGYRYTSLLLAWADSGRAELEGEYDRKLAGTLSDVLGDAVTVHETWEVAHPPGG